MTGSAIDGSILIGGRDVRTAATFRAIAAASGEPIGPPVSEADQDHVDAACALANSASAAFAALAPSERAAFLEAAGEAILAIGDDLIVTAMAESGLPRARLEGERVRTVNQLGMFAAEVRRGRWLDAVIDPALPDRTPPRPDIRRMNVPLGPVAVFGASNFPLAFSVAGGDTAAAFAAGCPVVFKGHPAHPGTGERVARALRGAVAAKGLPEGVFSYLPGRGNALGAALVTDPRIKAVGFTGSRGGGLALVALATARPEPIPVYAEMSSINPVVVLPRALAARGAALGTAFVGSLTLGAGQFCTNPGLVLVIGDDGLDAFLGAAAAALQDAPAATMLTPAIRDAYLSGVARLEASAATRAASGAPADENCVPAALFTTDADHFLADAALGHEVFGASSLVVRCASRSQLERVIGALEGQLTATIHHEPGDAADAAAILPLLAARAGRLLANGWPTGVEVAPAMVHGGPFPATSDGRSSSVGTLAMRRFLRPVAYQDFDQALLPAPLRDENPWSVPQIRGE
ncbi:aldehyde dehydrogenase (NADP(+)) [Parablastomonas sp. CN1-191]|uniref:aldehyde dehydrogenase (NADP(+)) n=1 Tax=Parablastomonas sp. CN1-191 TaxID=3400908 RepID=UPI003BF77BC9